MRFKAYIVSITPEEVEIDKNKISGFYHMLSDYIRKDTTEQNFIDLFEEISNNFIIKSKNTELSYYVLHYLKNHMNSILGTLKTTGYDKIVNISHTKVKESTRKHILQCGLLDCILGGLK